MKVLLVEDALGMRKLVSAMLQGMGLKEVVEAKDGAEGLEKLAQHRFDLVLTDWNMPVMDGIELIEAIRKTPGYATLPILLFTARSARDDVMRALQAGIDTYIAKPFTPQQLRTKIQSTLAKRAHQQISKILHHQDKIDTDDQHPIIIFGESATTIDELSLSHNKRITDFLADATTGVHNVDERTPDYRIGYLLTNSSTQTNQLLQALKERVKMLVVSSKLRGGGATLARLASINNRDAIGIFVVCDQLSEFSNREHQGLDLLNITIFERGLLHTADFEQMVSEKVVATMSSDEPPELPAPEEIRKRIDNDIRNMVDLPVLPQVYHQIVALDKNPKSEMADWITAIETDPLSTAQVIRRSRSPIYGFQGEINDIGKAVVLLGKSPVKEMIVSGAVKRSFESIHEEGFSVEDYWLHSVSVAITARVLAFPFDEKVWMPQHRKEFEELQLSAAVQRVLEKLALWQKIELQPEHDPFIGGMMHDIGKIALIQSYPGLYPMIIEKLQRESWNVPMRTAEDLFAGGAHHNIVGAILAESWKLGTTLTAVVESHHNPRADDQFSQLMALADFVGGYIYPYPKTAKYPMTHLLQDESLQADAKPPEDLKTYLSQEEETATIPISGEDPGPGAAAALAPGTAIYNFLPPNLLEQLEVEINELVTLARLLKPAVVRLTEEVRKSI